MKVVDFQLDIVGHISITFTNTGAQISYTDYVAAHPAIAVGYLKRLSNELAELIQYDEISS